MDVINKILSKAESFNFFFYNFNHCYVLDHTAEPSGYVDIEGHEVQLVKITFCYKNKF